MISNIKPSRMGTIRFDGKFAGMRKPQDFITYPIGTGQDASRAKVQSDTRIGFIDLTDGTVTMSAPVSSGAAFHHLATAKPIDKLTGEELLLLKAKILGTANGHAGTNGAVFTDNGGAMDVFAGT
jgi:hypothetical protein